MLPVARTLYEWILYEKTKSAIYVMGRESEYSVRLSLGCLG